MDYFIVDANSPIIISYENFMVVKRTPQYTNLLIANIEVFFCKYRVLTLFTNVK
jgi:hypothetical protein